MRRKKGIALAGFLLAGFLLVCAVINFVNRSTGAAIGSLGSGVFFFCLALAVEKENKGAP